MVSSCCTDKPSCVYMRVLVCFNFFSRNIAVFLSPETVHVRRHPSPSRTLFPVCAASWTRAGRPGAPSSRRRPISGPTARRCRRSSTSIRSTGSCGTSCVSGTSRGGRGGYKLVRACTSWDWSDRSPCLQCKSTRTRSGGRSRSWCGNRERTSLRPYLLRYFGGKQRQYDCLLHKKLGYMHAQQGCR